MTRTPWRETVLALIATIATGLSACAPTLVGLTTEAQPLTTATLALWTAWRMRWLTLRSRRTASSSRAAAAVGSIWMVRRM